MFSQQIKFAQKRSVYKFLQVDIGSDFLDSRHETSLNLFDVRHVEDEYFEFEWLW